MEIRLHGAQLVVFERRAHAFRPLVTGPGAAVAARAGQSARAKRHFHVVRIARVHVCEHNNEHNFSQQFDRSACNKNKGNGFQGKKKLHVNILLYALRTCNAQRKLR